MRAVAVRKFKDEPTLMDLPKPTPGPGEILVHLEAAGVNPYDWKIADGALDGAMPHVFPLILGVDGAGPVEALGPGVTRYSVGEGVFGQFLHAPVGIGTYAEYATVPVAKGISRMPRGMYSTMGAAVPTAGMTALYTLDRLGLKSGQSLLIMGAGGGIGSYAVQLASNQGIGTLAASRTANRDYLHHFGAHRVYDMSASGFLAEVANGYPDGVDGLLDVVHHGAEFEQNLSLVRPGGIVASTVGAVNEAGLAARKLRGMNISLPPSAELLDRLASEFTSGRLRIPLEETLALADAPDAIAKSRAGKSRGKIVLTI